MLVVILEEPLESFKIIQDTCCCVHLGAGNCCRGEFFIPTPPPPLRNKEGWWKIRDKTTFQNIYLNAARVEFQGAKGM